MAPKYWTFMDVTAELSGEGFADQSPLDAEVRWIFPRNSTQVEPPESEAGKARVFDEESETWSQVPDFRSTTWWFQGEPRVITELGQPEGGKQFGPPMVGENEIVIWTPKQDDWVIHKDYRGQYWWEAWDKPVLITELGDPAELGLSQTQPEPPVPEPEPEPEPIPELEQPLSKRQVTRAIILGTAATPNPIRDPDSYILTALEAIEDPTEQALAREDWKYSPYFLRNHPLFSDESVLEAAHFTPELVDQLWILGLSQPQ